MTTPEPAANPRTTLVNVPGVTVERYIGAGGMGAVYAGRIEATNRSIALKVLLPEASGDAARQRFEREARAMMAVRHENLCEAYAYGVVDDGRLYLAMELLEGEDLSARIAVRGPMAVAEALRWTRQAALGLGAAHDAGLVHRDIKPSNLFIHAGATLKVLDFGLAVSARAAVELDRVTRTGEIVGTPAFMAPEQARGDRSEDARTDVYGLGAVLHQLLTGSPPHGSGRPLEVLVRVLTEEAPPIRDRRPDVPEAVAALIHRMIDREPERRPASMAEVVAAIDAVTLGPETQIAPRSLTQVAPPGLTEEQRIVTVLIATDVAPDAHDTIADAITSFGGVATSLPGLRQVVAVFGGAVGEGDEPERAARAAARIQPYCRAVGVGTGKATAGRGGVAGEAVQAAADVTVGLAAGVALDAETRRRIGHAGPAKGSADGLTVVESVRDVELPLLGRDAELLTLDKRAERTFDDREAGIILITGAPGVGKSRLLTEAVAAQQRKLPELRVLTARGQSTRRFAPGWHLSAILRQRLGLPPEGVITLDEGRRRLGSLALETGLDRERLFLLAAPLGLPVPIGESRVLDAARFDGQVMKDQMVSVLGDVLRFDLESPVLIAVDDVQWIDTLTLDVLTVLVHRHAEAPLLLVLAGQRHAIAERPELLDDAACTEVALEDLPRRSATRLATVLGLNPATAERVAEHAGGNPLFVRELARALQEGGPDAAALPLSIEAAVQTRLDHLGQDDKDLIKRGSVLGVRLPTDALAALATAPIAAPVDRLVRADVWRRAEGHIVFRQAVFRDVAYGMLTSEQRRSLHARAGRHFAELAARDGLAMSSSVVDAANHLRLAGEVREAAPWFDRLAAVAERDGDLAAAAEALAHAIDGTKDDVTRIDLRLRRLGVAATAGLCEIGDAEVAALADEATPLDEHREADRLFWQGAMARWRGSYAAAREPLLRATAFYEVQGRSDWLSRALASLAVTTCYGRLGHGTPIAERAVAVAGSDPAARARALHALLAVHIHERSLAEAAVTAERAAEAAEAIFDLRRALEVRVTQAFVMRRMGDYRGAVERLRDAIARSQRIGNVNAEGYAWHNLSLALMHTGDLDGARQASAHAALIARRHHFERLNIGVRMYDALIASEAGDSVAALAAATESVETAQGTTEEAEARAVLATVLAAAGRFADAIRESAQARALAAAMGGSLDVDLELSVATARSLMSLGRAAEASATWQDARVRLLRLAEELAPDEVARLRYLDATSARRALRDAEVL